MITVTDKPMNSTNAFVNGNHTSSVIIRRSDDSLALQDKDKATALNSYFATIGERLNNLLPPPVTTHPVQDGLPLGEVPQLSEFHLSEIAVKRKVREL